MTSASHEQVSLAQPSTKRMQPSTQRLVGLALRCGESMIWSCKLRPLTSACCCLGVYVHLQPQLGAQPAPLPPPADQQPTNRQQQLQQPSSCTASRKSAACDGCCRSAAHLSSAPHLSSVSGSLPGFDFHFGCSHACNSSSSSSSCNASDALDFGCDGSYPDLPQPESSNGTDERVLKRLAGAAPLPNPAAEHRSPQLQQALQALEQREEPVRRQRPAPTQQARTEYIPDAAALDRQRRKLEKQEQREQQQQGSRFRVLSAGRRRRRRASDGNSTAATPNSPPATADRQAPHRASIPQEPRHSGNALQLLRGCWLLLVAAALLFVFAAATSAVDVGRCTASASHTALAMPSYKGFTPTVSTIGNLRLLDGAGGDVARGVDASMVGAVLKPSTCVVLVCHTMQRICTAFFLGLVPLAHHTGIHLTVAVAKMIRNMCLLMIVPAGAACLADLLHSAASPVGLSGQAGILALLLAFFAALCCYVRFACASWVHPRQGKGVSGSQKETPRTPLPLSNLVCLAAWCWCWSDSILSCLACIDGYLAVLLQFAGVWPGTASPSVFLATCALVCGVVCFLCCVLCGTCVRRQPGVWLTLHARY